MLYSLQVVLLVLANKTDLPQVCAMAAPSLWVSYRQPCNARIQCPLQALEADSLAEALGIDSDDGDLNLGNYDYQIVPCSALNGTGVVDAFKWLADRLKN